MNIIFLKPRHVLIMSFNIIMVVLFFLFSSVAIANPPLVARLNYTIGPVSFLPAGQSDWVEAPINRPLTLGDTLWVDKDGRAQLQLATSRICIGDNTSFSILNLDEEVSQFQISTGRISIRVRSLDPSQIYEIDTPTLAFTIQTPGDYRVEVNQEGNTYVTVYKGSAEVAGENVAYTLNENDAYYFIGSDLSNYDTFSPKLDDLDLWCFTKEKDSSQFVSNEVIGSEDLADQGAWQEMPEYGNVWTPTLVPEDWAPYRFGYWVWIAPWGWTWMDDMPWGFAPFHYGRWELINDQWIWIPGPPTVQPFYAPALVVFVNGDDEVAWFPLGFNELYWPPYDFNQAYFVQVNSGNIALAPAIISSSFAEGRKEHRFHHMQNLKAITAVPSNVLTESKPVQKFSKNINATKFAKGSVALTPNVTASKANIIGPLKSTNLKPPAESFKKPIITKNAPGLTTTTTMMPIKKITPVLPVRPSKEIIPENRPLTPTTVPSIVPTEKQPSREEKIKQQEIQNYVPQTTPNIQEEKYPATKPQYQQQTTPKITPEYKPTYEKPKTYEQVPQVPETRNQPAKPLYQEQPTQQYKQQQYNQQTNQPYKQQPKQIPSQTPYTPPQKPIYNPPPKPAPITVPAPKMPQPQGVPQPHGVPQTPQNPEFNKRKDKDPN